MRKEIEHTKKSWFDFGELLDVCVCTRERENEENAYIAHKEEHREGANRLTGGRLPFIERRWEGLC